MTMSHSTSSATQPLSDILPWGNPITVTTSDNIPSRNDDDDENNSSSVTIVEDDRTLLVTDAPSTDGRFVLHTLALQFLSSRYYASCSSHCQEIGIGAANVVATAGHCGGKNSNTLEGAVLWISCAPTAERQIIMGLRKALQHNLGGGGSGGEIGTSGIVKGSSSSRGGSIENASSCGPIHVISIPQELADAALLHHDRDDETLFSHEVYLKGLHRRIVHWLQHRELIRIDHQEQHRNMEGDHPTQQPLGPRLILCDNITTLGSLVGDRLATSFISSVRSSIRNISKRRKSSLSNVNTTLSYSAPNTTVITTVNLFVIRASSPDDGGLYNLDENDNSMEGQKQQHLRSEYSRLLRPWLGYGSGKSNNNNIMDGGGDRRSTSIAQFEEQCNYLSLSPDSVPSILYRSGLYEVADGIVDVSPLQSGYARDVLGRVSFVPTWSGQGWWGRRAGNASNKEDGDGAYASLCVNYRCDDSGVRIMRLRSR